MMHIFCHPSRYSLNSYCANRLRRVCLRGCQAFVAAALLPFLAVCGVAQAQFTVLHSFTELPDGRSPYGVSVKNGASLYGVAQYGGASNAGTVWSFDTTTKLFSNEHDFGKLSDGWVPSDLASDGKQLFGTTTAGGAYGNGVIWDLLGGAFDKRHDLSSAKDGASGRGVVLGGDQLYGVAFAGGAGNGGTIWSLDTVTAEFTTLHSLSPASDGKAPVGRPVLAGNMLYGTTSAGGANDGGVIWSLDLTTNNFKTLHEFAAASDGDSPVSDLMLSGNLLYGAAAEGGANGAGSVWSFDILAGTFTNLHDLDPLLDGDYTTGFLQDGDNLFGIAANGGAYGDGTIWSLDTATGYFSTLHAFQADTDGNFPAGHLVLDGKTLYGGTLFAGQNNGGTLWAVEVPEPSAAVLALLGLGTLAFARRMRGSRGFRL
jgi:uncharacterized repeat protein (TIGR03803 family)